MVSGMTMKSLKELPIEELRKISLLKNKRGTATSLAIDAQWILHLMADCSFSPHFDREKSASDEKYEYGDPNKFTKRFK